MLPFKQAILFPIIVSRHVSFHSLKGEIVLETAPKSGLVTIGFSGDDTIYPGKKFFFKLDGKIIFKGKANLGVGSIIRVDKNGVLEIGDNLTTGHSVKIICSKYVKIGNTVRIAWESQVIDTNFHYLRNVENGEIKDRVGNIIIGDFVWVGNRSTVQKGTVLGNNTIVTSNSICNSNFSNLEKFSIIGGMPAKFIKSGIERIFDIDEEIAISKRFQN
ncbi:acyltransferase [Flavobacterium litorale]|uniref:Acyltransferase n=1 Tax=Flavobacterium litorale TaxID=2856519 RepID=A0ABX8V7W2_9FLAO|nr:hypothetical protein [Flavobacterium litorale]QYJ67303.1 hypothetical protein K1I41_06910 [Flavobacterium litorale]